MDIPADKIPHINNPLFVTTIKNLKNSEIDNTVLSLDFTKSKFLNSDFNVVRLIADSVLELKHDDTTTQVLPLTETMIHFLVGKSDYIKKYVFLNPDESNYLRQIYSKNTQFIKSQPMNVSKKETIRQLYVKNPKSESPYKDALVRPEKSLVRPEKSLYTPPQRRQSKKTDDIAIGDLDYDPDEPVLGQKKRKQKGKGGILKLKPSGEFGSAVVIDVPELVGGKLYAYNKINGQKILSGKADKSLQKLLFQKYDPKEKYTNKALDIYKKLIERAGVNHNLGQKQNLVSGKFNTIDPKFYSNPEEVLNRLEKIISTITAGNDSLQIKNEGSNISDFLLSKKMMTKTQHKKMFQKYFT